MSPSPALAKKHVKFHWLNKCEHEFNDLKHALLSAQVVLYHPDWTVPFQVHVDANKTWVGAMLTLEKDGRLRPVRFVSRAFKLPKGRWHKTHQELYAIKWALEQFRPYILGSRTKVVTDHANLKWLATISPRQ